jgi:hypothetical protein
MPLEIDDLPEDVREEIERLRSVNRSMGAYLKLVEGALLAAWEAGEKDRTEILDRDPDDLGPEERQLHNAWELVREVVLRVPNQG